MVIQTIANAFVDNRKVSVGWFVNGKLMPSEDQLMLLFTSGNADSRSTPEYHTVASQIQQGATYRTENPSSYLPSVSGEGKLVLPPAKTVELFARLRFGRISKEDILYKNPSFTVPDYVLSALKEKWAKVSDAELVIWLDEKGKCACQVDTSKKTQGWQQFVILQPDEKVVLQTRMKFGTISYDTEKSDAFYRCDPNWKVPAAMSNELKQKYRTKYNAELIGISNSKMELRFVVIDGSGREEWPQRNKIV